MSIKLVAFDWNGTILADAQGMVRANNAVLRHFKLEPINLKRYRDTFQVPIKSYWMALGFDPDLFDRIAKEQEKIFQKSHEPEEKKCRARLGIKEVLSFLAKQKVESVIFSNHITAHIEKKLENLCLANRFTAVLARAVNDRGHQHKRFKDQILNEYIRSKGIKPHEVMVVGDTEEEIEIGRKFGYTTVALTGGHNSVSRLKAQKPDYLIAHLKELKRIIPTL